MECLHPLEVPIKVNGVKTNSYQVVPCGRCLACKEKRQQEWIFRLEEEFKRAKFSYFVTFTYDNDHPPIKPYPNLAFREDCLETYVLSVNKRDPQTYLKRLRKRLPAGSLRYFLVSEYGSKTHRPHYHGIFFYSGEFDIADLFSLDWHHGFIQVGSVTTASITYTTKYLFKESYVPPYAEKCFALSSKRPAIGLCYLQDNTSEYHVTHPYLSRRDGSKLGMPRYFKDKLNCRTSSAPSEMEKFLADHPDKTIFDYYLQRDARVKAYESNKQKRLNHNETL